MSGIVIVGAGLGGLRAAESARVAGYQGPITMIGDEPHLPYSRPPLSKEGLAAGIDVAALEFRRKRSLADVDWLLHRAAVGCDLAAREVHLNDGRAVSFDALVVASGIRARRLPLPGPAEGRYLLRTADDALRLHERLTAGARVVVLGSGFIGCEVAATARSLGCEVCVVALDPVPLLRPLGAHLGAAMQRRHESHGVRFQLSRTIDVLHERGSQVRSVGLSDGTELPADVVVEAVGSVPNVEWLAGNGLDLSDGVLVDSAMQVVASPAPMVAVGDICRHPNALFGPVPRRVEHWSVPTATARRAGATVASLLAGERPDRSPFAVLPSFWSDQYAYQLQSFGMPDLADRIVVAEGDVDGPCIVEYFDATGLVGVVGVDRTPDLAPYRASLLDRPLLAD